MNTLIMADGQVGLEITTWLLENYSSDISLLVSVSDNEIKALGDRHRAFTTIFKSSEEIFKISESYQINFDIGFLLWWPKIVKKPLINLPTHGFINTHPSLLPFCRGKHYNFWTLVEGAPYGVSLHFIDEGIDTGDVVAQQEISYDWEDTGQTLYQKAIKNMIQLFQTSYPKIRSLNVTRVKQDLSEGSFHLAKELELASVIQLDKSYMARDLINLIRARTFPGHPACRFSDNGKEYEVRISIERKL